MKAVQGSELANRIQALFRAGAVFTFGQEKPPELKAQKYEPTQPVLAGPTLQVTSAHDGGAWIGFTTASGTCCRTASDRDAKKLRELIACEKVDEQGWLGHIGVHLAPICGIQ